MNSTLYDAAVVGAGPAGSATAAFLAERGFSVALLERSTFPRPKPCAEYLSPEASRVLDRLGVRKVLEAGRVARLEGMKIIAPSQTSFVGRFAGDHSFRGHTNYGLALRREILDAVVAQAAVQRGATLFERTVVEGLGDVEQRHRTLYARSGNRNWVLRTRLVVGADGLNSRVARMLGVSRQRGRRRIALVTHAAGMKEMENVGEMHVGQTGYVGLAPVGEGLTNVAVVVDLDRVTHQASPATWFHELLRQYPAVSTRLAGASFVTPVRCVGPFARRASPATCDRSLLVGDAADFYDPFTGEGIYAALHGAELAAAMGSVGLEQNKLDRRSLSPYDTARRRAFGGKWLVERLVSWAVAHPTVFNHVALRLAARPRLADLLVGVAGDFVPPSQVLRPSFAWQLIR
jgi:geranylgeranyl reductase family protein